MFHGIIPSVRAKDDASTLGCRQAVRHQTLTLTCVGSNPAIPAKYDPLAQSVEQLPFKQWVWSSNLQRVTKKEISPRGYLFFDTRGDSKNSMEQSGGLFLGIGSTMPTPYPVPLHRGSESPAGHQEGVVSLSAPMGQNSQNIQCHCEPVTDVTGVAIPRIGVKSKIS